MSRHNRIRRIVLFIVAVLLLAPSVGCIGLIANLIHAANGNLMPASYDGFIGKRVAVVCVSNADSFGPTSASFQIAKRVSDLLKVHVKEIDVVDQQEVTDWIDRHDWDYANFVQVGKGVDADIVLAVVLENFRLYDGKTLYKGRADVEIVAYDLTKKGAIVFESTPPQIQFPANVGLPVSESSENDFRRRFLAILSGRIARNFYEYDLKEDYAYDATIVTQ
ncbi:MAG: hypothetical protein R3C28_29935 [Pirellulaceae bacterium]